MKSVVSISDFLQNTMADKKAEYIPIQCRKVTFYLSKSLYQYKLPSKWGSRVRHNWATEEWQSVEMMWKEGDKLRKVLKVSKRKNYSGLGLDGDDGGGSERICLKCILEDINKKLPKGHHVQCILLWPKHTLLWQNLVSKFPSPSITWRLFVFCSSTCRNSLEMTATYFLAQNSFLLRFSPLGRGWGVRNYMIQ